MEDGTGKDQDKTNDPPPPSPERPLVEDSPIVKLEDVDVTRVDAKDILPCESTTKQLSQRDELVRIFEQINCLTADNNLDQNCLNRYNYDNCYKPIAPSPNNSSVITCTIANKELSFAFNTYNTLPGESLLCDIIDSEGSMLFYARNRLNGCRSMWSRYKSEQGYRCSDDPPVTEPAPAEPAPAEMNETESYYTISHQAGDVIVTVSLDEDSVDLAEGACVQVKDVDFTRMSITADAGKDVCSAGNCGEANDYTVEARSRFLRGTVYRLVIPDKVPLCDSTVIFP